jgi:hypothetical protein
MGAPARTRAASIGRRASQLAQGHWRLAVGLLVCVALPLGSWVGDGRGRFAFTMYSSTATYRLEIASVDVRGERHAVRLTDVAHQVSFDSAAPFLAGADVYRTVPQIDALRDHLRDVARAACRMRRARIIEITLHERARPPDSETEIASEATPITERVTCPRPG